MAGAEVTNAANLVTYCGGYCGSCWIRNGQIRGMAKALQETLRGWAFPDRARAMAGTTPAAGRYSEFEGVLEWVQAQACPGCRQVGSVTLWGDPNCFVRDCVREKGLTGCFECSEEKACEKIATLDHGDPTMPGNRQRMREVGLEAWAAEQASK